MFMLSFNLLIEDKASCRYVEKFTQKITGQITNEDVEY